MGGLPENKFYAVRARHAWGQAALLGRGLTRGAPTVCFAGTRRLRGDYLPLLALSSICFRIS